MEAIKHLFSKMSTFLLMIFICSIKQSVVLGQLSFNNPMYKPDVASSDEAGMGVDWIHSGDPAPPPPQVNSYEVNNPQVQVIEGYLSHGQGFPGQNPHGQGFPGQSQPGQAHGFQGQNQHGPGFQGGHGQGLLNPGQQNPNSQHGRFGPNPQQGGALPHGQISGGPHRQEVVVEDSLKQQRPSFEFNGMNKFDWDEKEDQKQRALSEKMAALGISKGNENYLMSGGGVNLPTHERRDEYFKAQAHQMNSQLHPNPNHGPHQTPWIDKTLQERPKDFYKGKINYDPKTALILENFDKRKAAELEANKNRHQNLQQIKGEKASLGKGRSHRLEDPPAEIRHKEKWFIDDEDYESAGTSYHPKNSHIVCKQFALHLIFVIAVII